VAFELKCFDDFYPAGLTRFGNAAVQEGRNEGEARSACHIENASMLRHHLATGLALTAALLLPSCAGSVPTGVQADCRGLSGRYWDAGEPEGASLLQFLMKHKPVQARQVALDVNAQRVQASTGGAAAGTLFAEKDFACNSADRLVLARQETSPIRLPPLIDQTQTVTYVLTGGAGADLVLTSYVQTTVAPYGARLKGPMQRESTVTWRRAGP
jgi:hypothetical protein